MTKPTIIRRVRTLCSPAESQAIIDALVGGTVPDTRGFGATGLRVAEFMNQHAAGGKYAALYPVPEEDTGSDDPDPFLVVAAPLVCEMWQFDYGDEVHGHLFLSDGTGFAAVPARSFRNAQLEFIGACSRRPADTDRGDNVAAYFIGRNDSAASGRVFFHVSELPHSIGPYIASGPDMLDAQWDAVSHATAPGTDLVYDATSGAAVVEAVYMTTPK